jgi:GDPmannose 4,6-dehydratase
MMRSIAMSKKALVTGITGQDGAYLAQHLLNEGYEVFGAQRRNTGLAHWRLDRLGITNDIEFVDFELNEMTNIFRVLEKTAPDEIYNLAAQSFVHLSFEQPLYTSDCDYMGPTRILEAMRTLYMEDDVRFYQAGTSEMFGKVQEIPQSETTPFYPRSPYGVAKLGAYWMTVNYRESYDMFACNGILFNHESPLRGEEFVTRKLVRNLVKVKNGDLEYVEMGNMDAKRDWGHAKDYVEGMYLMMQQDKPDDYVLSMEETHTVREFAQIVCNHLNLNIDDVIKINPKYLRPAEVELLMGDSTKARVDLKWSPKYTLDTLIEEMVTEELKYYGS